ncbi:MAG: hypothetical protein ACXWCU_08740 [Caldimonas sp.]
MALIPMRGALVEYSGQFLGPIPNIVIFQFNPETLSRTITIPQATSASNSAANRPKREVATTEAPAVESFTVTAQFSAADDLGTGGAVGVLPRLFGVGPQLAALEKMVYPVTTPGGLIGAAIDAVGSALSSAAGGASPTRPVPPQKVPRLLFIWGPTRVLPVRITSMSINEKQYDMLLNPTEAEVQIGLSVVSTPSPSDAVAVGAWGYSQMIKDTQATLNLAKVIEFAVDLVPL